MQLLEDDSEAVRVEAAKALTVLTQHSSIALSRIGVGVVSQTPEKASKQLCQCLIAAQQSTH